MEVSGQHLAPAALNPRQKKKTVPIDWEAGWAKETVWTFGRIESAAPAGIRMSDRPVSILTQILKILFFCNKIRHIL